MKVRVLGFVGDKSEQDFCCCLFLNFFLSLCSSEAGHLICMFVGSDVMHLLCGLEDNGRLG